jgi:hypothetical protein
MKRDRVYIAEHQEELLQKYNKRWIGLLDGEVLATGMRPDTLLRQLRRKGVDIGDVVVDYITDEPKSMLL